MLKKMAKKTLSEEKAFTEDHRKKVKTAERERWTYTTGSCILQATTSLYVSLTNIFFFTHT